MLGIFEGKNDVGKTNIPGLKEYYLIEGEIMSQDFVDLYRKYILKEEVVHEKRLLHSAFVERPRFSEVYPEKGRSVIVDSGNIAGYIYYKAIELEKIPYRVDWIQDKDMVYKSEYYNQYGFPYCSRYFDDEVGKAFDIYFTEEHQEMIQINHTNSSVVTYKNNQIHQMYSHIIYLLGDIFCNILKEEELYTNTDYVMKRLPKEKTFCDSYVSKEELFRLAEELNIPVKKWGVL